VNVRTNAIVELEGVNGDWFTLSGEGMGEQGTHLGTDVDNIYDTPIKTLYTEHAFQEGATYNGKRVLRRDLVMGLWVTDDNGESWQENDSRLRKALSYENEFKLWITDPDRGSRRHLKMRLSEQPQVKMDNDPRLLGRQQVVLTCTAGDPWWYDEDYTYTWASTEDTTDGHFQMGTVTVQNPTDHEVYPQWLLRAPGQPRLPDFSWGDKRHNGYGTNGYFDAATAFATRQITVAELLPDHPVRIDTRPDARHGGYQSTDQNYRQRMKMVRFLYPIPPYTKAIELPVGMSKALANTEIQLRLPQPWSRPWGLEA
jgi:hypothetical protein